MKTLQKIETVNLFRKENEAMLFMRCNLPWWPARGDDEFKSLRYMELNEPLIHSLRSTRNGYPTYIMDLLKELYRELYKEEPTKGFIRRLMEGGKPVQWWQWDLFEELKWRVANGSRHYNVITELKRRVCLFLEYEDVVPSSWGARKDLLEAWRKLRMEVIEVYGGNCAACGRNQKDHGVVIHVDHIIPKADVPALALHFSNLQLLCEDCNLGKGREYTTDWRSEACINDIEDLIHSPEELEDTVNDQE